ncbi:DEKNAAC103841 [Brettanomyces naardenensis]|uniref:DEKNAAC103842 n=1 Tax=Brettanomyces naardenensis TaxID=13370 RepID=A0A448YPA7_BRENA|nr:DEKNAAC103841 [Brettanomyces naardenensis]
MVLKLAGHICSFLQTKNRGKSGSCSRSFSCSTAALSHIGSNPVFVPPDVKIETNDFLIPKVIPKGRESISLSKLLTIRGPRGVVDIEVPEFLRLQERENHVIVGVDNPSVKIQKSLWGTMRALINNGVIGVTEGHMTVLRFKGTGYRVMLEKDDKGTEWVKMKIGKCDLQGLPIPEGIKCSVPTTTLLVLEGCNKQQLNLFAGRLRNMHPPEPYKGKGIYMNGEDVRLKSKKVK